MNVVVSKYPWTLQDTYEYDVRNITAGSVCIYYSGKGVFSLNSVPYDTAVVRLPNLRLSTVVPGKSQPAFLRDKF